MADTQFGKMVHHARRSLGLTLDQVAKRIGSHKGYMSGIERGTCNPPAPDVCRKLANVLGLSADNMVALSWIEKRPKGVKLARVQAMWPTEVK